MMTAQEIYDEYIGEYGDEPFVKSLEVVKQSYTQAVADFEDASEAAAAERAFCKIFAYDLLIKRLLNHDLTELGFSDFADGLLVKETLGMSRFDFIQLRRLLNRPFRELEVWYAKFKYNHEIDSYTDVSEAWESDALWVVNALTIGQLSISKELFDTDMIDYDYEEEPYVSGQEAIEEAGVWTGDVLSRDEAFEIVDETLACAMALDSSNLVVPSVLSPEAANLVLVATKVLTRK